MTEHLFGCDLRDAGEESCAGEVELYSNGGGSAACDFDFRVGEEYLVYAHARGDAPGWMTSTCSRTRRLRDASEDLRYLRTPDEQKPPSHIAGRVTRYVHDLSQANPGHSVPVPGVPVVVTRGQTRLESKTDSDGSYLIHVDPGDAYQVGFGPVDGLTIRGRQQVAVPHPRACAIADASVAYDGRVSGQIVDDLGLPVPFLPITLASSPRYLQRHTLTDVAGRFQFDVIYPGPHSVTPGTDLWQGALALSLTPAPLTVPAAGHVDAGQLRIPSSVKLRLVEILIEDSTGNPASDAYVSFRQPDVYSAISYAPQPRADERGAFRLSVAAGQRYEVSAQYDLRRFARPF